MKTLIKSIALTACLLSSTSVWAQIPETQRSLGISYISGGVGEGESAAILAEAKHWPLLLELSQLENGRGVWIFGSQIKIANSKSAVIFDAKAQGPYMLVNLEPGDYVIQASYQGVEQKRAISIKAGQPQKISLFWK
ncbi:carboxypeptidase regulatory-like domain-containing protein [Polynucleobacter sp. AP-Melu-500A-A1]|uniref:carboxypeptidase regulatory-like domain-containing protein n=1 Tax=Polynucleobacter sp. AP-Melu-500A-A1 TaxID=2576929 RepID=UPI001C0BBDBC|nr:carboxypeptidase regulatory-like domain-containing protein [Polynucleobacter sp. AP-Melu-500A-A1]MBU3631214.1 carboxypeptidase regulatory-like domain-containing protein [Polynucleobacter sp. AP-Melu-500A-A1]